MGFGADLGGKKNYLNILRASKSRVVAGEMYAYCVLSVSVRSFVCVLAGCMGLLLPLRASDSVLLA